MMFSGLSRHNGTRVTGAASTSRTISSVGWPTSTMIISVRWTITSETSSSGRSSKPPNMSRSSFSTPPSRCRRSTAPRSSSCAERIGRCSPTRIPTRDRIQRTSASIAMSTGPNRRTTHSIGLATINAMRSGALMAAVLGRTSANTTSSTVMKRVA